MFTAGMKTSEFLLSVVVIIAATVLTAMGALDADDWSIAAGIASAGYGVSRGLAKN